MQGHDINVASGDVSYALFNAVFLMGQPLWSGEPLVEVLKISKATIAQHVSGGQENLQKPLFLRTVEMIARSLYSPPLLGGDSGKGVYTILLSSCLSASSLLHSSTIVVLVI